MKSKIAKILLITIIVISLTSCSAITEPFKEAIKNAVNKTNTSETKIFTSSDNKFQVTGLASWSDKEALNEVAAMSLMNGLKEQYLMVIPENAADFTEDFTINDYYDIISENMSSGLTEPQNSQVVTDETSAIKTAYFELSGAVDKIKISYYIQLYQTEKAFYQVIAWTLQSKAEANKDVLVNAVKSFKELP